MNFKTEHRLMLMMLDYLHCKHGGIFMPNFYFMWYEADLLWLTDSDYATEFEIKVSRSDFKADAKKRCAHLSKAEYLVAGKTVNYFYYVVPRGLIAVSEVPNHAGLIEVGDYFDEITYSKKAPKLHKNKSGLRSKIYEKCYYRYYDKILVPYLRKFRGQLYEKKHGKLPKILS